MPAIAYLEVAVLPHYYADWEIWSLVRFFIDGDDDVWMTVDDSEHIESVSDYPTDEQIREEMLPYLRHVQRTGQDPLRIVTPAKIAQGQDLGSSSVTVRWDFEVDERSDGLHVRRVRRGAAGPWISPRDAPRSVQDYLLLTDEVLLRRRERRKRGKNAYAGSWIQTDWRDVEQMRAAVGVPKSPQDVALAAIGGGHANEVWFYPVSIHQRCAVEVPMPRAEWRPFIHPKAEASRMLKGFG